MALFPPGDFGNGSKMKEHQGDSKMLKRSSILAISSQISPFPCDVEMNQMQG